MIRKKVLQASAKDIEHDINARRVVALTDAEQQTQRSMIELRLDQLAAFEARLAEHEEAYRLKKNGLQNWLLEHEKVELVGTGVMVAMTMRWR